LFAEAGCVVIVNFYVGWIAILAGLVAGAAIGMFFHREDWLEGYGSWRRRMLRLVHISMLGTGLLNLAFALSLPHLRGATQPQVASVLFVVGAVSMPLVCGLAAWRKPMRHLFFIPVLSLVLATAFFLYQGLVP
jgi:hypothetical protein